MSQTPRGEGEPAGRGKALWQSKVVIAAGVVTVAGLAMWVYAMATAAPAPAGPGPGVDPSLVSGLSVGEVAGRAGETSARLIDSASPALLRFGLSFLVGVVLAYLFKKFLKVSVIVAALIGAAVFGLHKTGIIDFDAGAVKEQVDRGVTWARSEASGFKDFIVGYLPSSVSACAGLIYGAIKG